MLKEAACVEEELCNIIRSKDKQIDDYKASGATVSRRELQTFILSSWRSTHYFSCYKVTWKPKNSMRKHSSLHV
jgi:hypothetical protein